MEIQRKSLKDISWDVDENTYRSDPALSYSTLSRYEREGFNGLPRLFDKISTPSLVFGAATDALITGGEEEFNERFIVAKFPEIKDSIIPIVKELYDTFGDIHTHISEIPDGIVIDIAGKYNYQNNWKPETRARVIKESAGEYYKLLYISQDKTIIDTSTYQDVLNCVDALRSSESTKWYFQKDNPWDGIERFYQLKFKHTYGDIEYRCMSDLLVCDHNKKIIYPIDLKTSSKPEYDFYKSFIDWNYSIQARLYWRIIRANLDKDPIYKDYKLADYRFIVVNRKTLVPLVWGFDMTQALGLLRYGINQDILLRDPYDIGWELNYYLKNNPRVPVNVSIMGVNSITRKLEEYVR